MSSRPPSPPQSPRPPAEPPPEYTKYRAGPKLLDRLRPAGGDRLRGLSPGGGRRDGGQDRGPGGRRFGRWLRKPITPWRVVRWIVGIIVFWFVLSLVLFLISAQLEKSNIPDSAKSALNGGGSPPFSATTILVLGSDQRPKGTHEAGASTSGPSRSDTMLLIRIGGGHNARLSIPRDTLVTIPGHGQSKINAAYAYGGAALAIKTVESYLGIKIDHLMQVSFTNFPQLIDAMGGVDIKTGCVFAKVNGGWSRGGITFRLHPGVHHLNGRHALALSRVRENTCNPRENELTRERRQQQLISAMKSRVLSPSGFIRLPWISWSAPKALQTDMGGPTLLGVFSAMAVSGSPPTRILKPDGVSTGAYGQALLVSDAEKRAAVRQFLK